MESHRRWEPVIYIFILLIYLFIYIIIYAFVIIIFCSSIAIVKEDETK